MINTKLLDSIPFKPVFKGAVSSRENTEDTTFKSSESVKTLDAMEIASRSARVGIKKMQE